MKAKTRKELKVGDHVEVRLSPCYCYGVIEADKGDAWAILIDGGARFLGVNKRYVYPEQMRTDD